MKQRTGQAFYRASTGKWYSKVNYTDPVTKKRRELVKTARDEDHARELLATLLDKLASASPIVQPEASVSDLPDPDSGLVTFQQLANAYSDHKVRPAQYRNDRKIAGLRSERLTVASHG